MSNIQKSDAPKALTFKQIQNQLAAASNVKEALTLDFVVDRFIKNYESVTGRKDGANRFHGELFAYLEILEEKPQLKNVDRFYHMSALMKVGYTGLSFQDKKLYVMPSGSGLKVDTSPAGKREQLEMMKDIKRVPEAVIVFKGDKFIHDKLNGVVKVHETTEQSTTKQILENIVATYTRVYFKDNTIQDVVVYNEDLVKAKNASKAKSDQAAWGQWTGEMAKKVSTNRAHRLYYKKPNNIVMLGADLPSSDDTTDIPHTEVDADSIINTPSGEQVDQTSGEVIEPTLDITNDQETSAKKDKKNKRDNPATLSEEEKFT